MAEFNTDLKVFSNSDSLAYPSANAINGGELNSEENIKNIVTRISTKSFVIKRLPNADNTEGTVVSEGNTTLENDSSFGLSYSGSVLFIAPGECNIRGYYFRCKSQTGINLNDYISSASDALYDLYTNWESYIGEDSGSTLTLYVYLTVKTDSSNHILSYSNIDLTFSNFEGVVVSLTTEPQSIYDLLLGTIDIGKTSSGFEIRGCTNNSNKFTFIDTNDIFHYDEDTDTIISLYEMVLKYIRDNMQSNIYNDLTVFGPTPPNTDGTTNIFITSNTGDKLFRLFYNVNDNRGGLALHSGSIDAYGNVVIGQLLKELLVFTNLPTNVTDTNPLLAIGADLTVNGTTTLTGFTEIENGLTVYPYVNVGEPYNSADLTVYGNIIVADTTENSTTITSESVTANKVYGAVWA